MKINELKERITKKEAQIVKINKRVAKWSVGLTEDEKEIAKLSYKEICEKLGCKSWEVKEEIRELHQALEDLKSAHEIINKYSNALELEEAKANEEKIPVIVDFLNNWKKDVAEYITRNVNTHLVKYYELDRKVCDLHNRKYYYINNGMTEDEWKEEYIKTNKERKEESQMIHPLSKMVYSRNAEDKVNHERLDEILNDEAEARYFKLVEQVTKITGKIIDASYLEIGLDGDLNGVIVGEEGKAKVNTIGAGGYNIQCYHYRTLVKKMK